MTDLREQYRIACPKCGQAQRLHVQIVCVAELTIDGSEAFGDHEWDEASFCCRPDRGHTGEVDIFTIPQKETA